MDPFTTLRAIHDASQDRDVPAWFYALDDLHTWLARGGLSPASGVNVGSVAKARSFVAWLAAVLCGERHVTIFHVGASKAADPDLAFYNHDDDEPGDPGWYAWTCLPGCLPDSDPYYCGEHTERAAVEAYLLFVDDDCLPVIDQSSLYGRIGALVAEADPADPRAIVV